MNSVRMLAIGAVFLCVIGAPLPCLCQRLPDLPMAGDWLDVDVTGRLYVLDSDRNTLTVLGEAGMRLDIGGPGWREGRFDRPSGIWARNGMDVFVADYGNHRIQRFDRTLSFVSSLSTRDSDDPDQRFGYPSDVALNRQGDLFVCDTENGRVVKVNRLSKVDKVFGGFDAGLGRLRRPTRLGIGPRDQVFVVDDNRIVVFDSFGNYVSELYPDIVRHPACLATDDEGVLVLDSGTLYAFDAQLRPVAVSSVASAVGLKDVEVRSLTVSNGVLYILTAEGIYTGRDPRLEESPRLDKEGKTH